MEVAGTGLVGQRIAQAAAAGNARAGRGRRERRHLRWWRKGAGGDAVGYSGAGAARRFGNPSGGLKSLGASCCSI
jgi:hypothetical protein